MAISDAIDILTSRPHDDPIETLKKMARFGRSFELFIEGFGDAFGGDTGFQVTTALGAIIDFLMMLTPDDSRGVDLKKFVEQDAVEATADLITDPFAPLFALLSMLGGIGTLTEIPVLQNIGEFGNIIQEGMQQGGGKSDGILPFSNPEDGAPTENAASILGMDDDGGGDISDILSADGQSDISNEPDILNPRDTQEDLNSLWDTIEDLDEDSLTPEQSQQLDKLIDDFLDELGTEDDTANLFGSK